MSDGNLSAFIWNQDPDDDDPNKTLKLSQDEVDKLFQDFREFDDSNSFNGLGRFKPKSCECGAEKTYGPHTGHSNWCPKGN